MFGQLWFVLLVVAAAFIFMGGLADALAEMHNPGETAHGPMDLTSVRPFFVGESPVPEVFRTWRDWQADFGEGWLTPRWLLGVWLVIDTALFAPGVALLLLHAQDAAERSASGIAARSTTAAEDERRKASREALSAAIPVIGAYVLFDVLENVLVAVAASQWESAINPWFGRAIAGSSLLKWLSIVLVIVPTVAVWLSGSVGRPQSAKAPGWSVLLRAQVIAVGAYAALFVRVDQVDDVVLTWGSTLSHAIAAGVAALAAAVTVALTGRALLRDYERRRPPARAVEPRFWIPAGAAGVAAALVVAAVASPMQPSRWALVVVPAAALAFGLLAVPGDIRHLVAEVPADSEIRRRSVDRAADALRWLVPVPLVALALAAVRAIPPALFLDDEGLPVVLVPAGVAAVLLAVVWLWATYGGKVILRPRSPDIPFDGVKGFGPAPVTETLRRSAWGLAAIGVMGVVWVSSIDAPQFLGSAALIGGLAAVAALVLSPFTRARLRPARGPLRILGFRYVPAFALLLAWGVAAFAVTGTGGFHDARLLRDTDPKAIDLHEAWEGWLQANGLPADSASVAPAAPAVGGPTRVVPMVFLATAGGATRSAYWTSLALDCLFGDQGEACPQRPWEQGLDESAVFLASGISGGSVGMAVWHATQLAGEDGGQLSNRPPDKAWYEAIYEQDLLAPTIGRMLSTDLPNAWLQVNRPDDRAAVLERALEQAVSDAGYGDALRRGLFESARKGPDGAIRFPLLLLNGASVEDGCRLNGSALLLADPNGTTSGSTEDLNGSALQLADPETAPTHGADDCLTIAGTASDEGEIRTALAGSRDIYFYLCRRDGHGDREDIALSTAAMLSARFPYVTPSGALHSCDDEHDRTFIVDGGTVDSSAASTATEVLVRLHPVIDQYNREHPEVCVAPVLLQLDNGYTDLTRPPPSSRPPELLAPLIGAIRAAGARADSARQMSAIAFASNAFDGSASCPLPVRRYVQLAPESHPGIESAMGWTLSRESRHDLRDEFREAVRPCYDELASWFGGAAATGGTGSMADSAEPFVCNRSNHN